MGFWQKWRKYKYCNFEEILCKHEKRKFYTKRNLGPVLENYFRTPSPNQFSTIIFYYFRVRLRQFLGRAPRLGLARGGPSAAARGRAPRLGGRRYGHMINFTKCTKLIGGGGGGWGSKNRSKNLKYKRPSTAANNLLCLQITFIPWNY